MRCSPPSSTAPSEESCSHAWRVHRGVVRDLARDLEPLIDHEGVPEDIFCELYRELAPAAEEPAHRSQRSCRHHRQPRQSRRRSRRRPRRTSRGSAHSFDVPRSGTSGARRTGRRPLSNRYFNLLAGFIEKFSLRYDLRRPCTLCPTLPGLLTNLVQHMRSTSQADAHLAKLNHEFEEAIRGSQTWPHGKPHQVVSDQTVHPGRGHREHAQRNEPGRHWGNGAVKHRGRIRR